MLDPGVLLSETADLIESDVHIEDRYVKGLGKGNRERIVGFGATCQWALLQYLHRFRGAPAHPDIDQFFLTIGSIR